MCPLLLVPALGRSLDLYSVRVFVGMDKIPLEPSLVKVQQSRVSFLIGVVLQASSSYAGIPAYSDIAITAIDITSSGVLSNKSVSKKRGRRDCSERWHLTSQKYVALDELCFPGNG